MLHDPRKVDIHLLASWVGSKKWAKQPFAHFEEILKERLASGEILLKGKKRRDHMLAVCRGVRL